ncbi:MAG: U32 family peptidase [Desulfobacterales bacterium]|nr:U32 family peptidase [Desulfobacterales bacterium]MCP4158462.1 U32 family peptidase [Deltaproteobacteria bacterium]
MSLKKPELLAPAGNYEKLEIAIKYGADAVYLAGKEFSLRSYSDNFSLTDIEKGIEFAHNNNVKVYVACNIYSRNNEQEEIANYLEKIKKMKPDAFIISDPGIIMLAQGIAPEIDIHLSTQSNTTNYNTVKFWKKLGITRVNTARELSLKDIEIIAQKGGLEVEAFVHGAMCISQSGRCLLSSFMINRDANRGLCSHPCRWKYSLVEEKRPGEYVNVTEDERGSYFFNSKDLNLIEHIPELIESGLDSLKIEGRIKGINYLASVVKVYREAIDLYTESPKKYKVKNHWLKELTLINNRTYCTGFYFGNQDEVIPNYEDLKPNAVQNLIGKILETDDIGYKVIVRNRFFKNDKIKVFTSQKGPSNDDVVKKITDLKGIEIDVAQPNMQVYLSLNGVYNSNDLIRILSE